MIYRWLNVKYYLLKGQDKADKKPLFMKKCTIFWVLRRAGRPVIDYTTFIVSDTCKYSCNSTQ